MYSNMFNFVTGIITCLLHYRSKQAKDTFVKKLSLVQNPNETEKEDLVYDRESADNFFEKCTPFTTDTVFENKLLLRSEDTLLPRRLFDSKQYITMHYDIGKRLRSEFKIGFRQPEVEYIKKKASQIEKWAFALAEFNIVLAYRTIDEQGFVLIAELMEGDNKFDKAMRIAQVIYEYLGFNVGERYVGFLPETKIAFSSDVCPMSFDENYLFGYLDEQGKFFGSFDCMKLSGNAESVLKEHEIDKQGDIRNEQISFKYANEMEWFEEKKYDVINTTGLDITIRAGIKPESEWILPSRQLEFTDDGIKVIYNNVTPEEQEKRSIDKIQIEALQSDYPDDLNTFSTLDKNGLYEPCNMRKLKDLCRQYETSGMLDTPLVSFGGYKCKETGKFSASGYIVFRMKEIQNKEQMMKFFKEDKFFKTRVVCFFDCQEDLKDFCVVMKKDTGKKYQTAWATIGIKLQDLSIDVYSYTGNEDCLLSLPDVKTLRFAD